MLVGTQQRKRSNSTKVNLAISLTFHGILVLSVLYFAARQGLIGKTLQKISVEMVKTDKPKEPVKPKEPEKPKVDEAKAPETPKVQEVAKIETTRPVPPPAASTAPPAVAPPAAEAPSFDFEGGQEHVTTTDPVVLYKTLLQNALRLNWDRPKDVDDHTNVAEVEVAVDKTGAISNPVWKKKTGQKQWDDSVSMTIASTKSVFKAPPSNFPSRVVIRFDVTAATALGEE